MLVLALGASAAQAYRFAGPRWPNRTITVANEAPRYKAAVSSAMRAWNRARVGVRFARASSERARVIFRYANGGSGRFGCEGIAGGTRAGYPSPFLALDVFVIDGCRNARLRKLTAAHELGHGLGLDHEDRRCALMNSTGSLATLLPSRCRPGGIASRRLVLADDVRGARALYRRRPAPVDPGVARFNPGNGTRMPIGSGTISFATAVRNRALEFRWDFGQPASGPANRARGLDTTHTYAQPGTYTVTLRVLDGGALIAGARNTLVLY